MARKIASQLDSLISKAKAIMAGIVKSAKKAKINKKKVIAEARDKVMGISEKMDVILAKAYPVIVQGIMSTNASKFVTLKAQIGSKGS